MTRLCPPLTPQEAAGVQRACIRLLCERGFRSWQVRPALVISPDDSEREFREIVGPYVPILPQGDGDLGARLLNVAERVLSEEPLVLLVGSDSPTLPEEFLREAATLLKTVDAVLGPCADGGFYLLGLRRVHRDMFRGVTWGTAVTAKQTLAALAKCGMSVAELDPWYDVDDTAGLRRAADDLRRADAPDGFELLRTLEQALQAAERRRAKTRR